MGWLVRFSLQPLWPQWKGSLFEMNRAWIGSSLSGQFGEYVSLLLLQPIEPMFLGRIFCNPCTISTVCSLPTISNSALKELCFNDVKWNCFWINLWWRFNIWDFLRAEFWNFFLLFSLGTIPRGLRLLSCWGCAFESRQHGSLSLVAVVCC
jgi:hypothetical protein